MKTVLSLILLALAIVTHAQSYKVSKIKGTVYRNHVMLKEGDTFTNTDTITSADPFAAIRVLSNVYGSFVVSFPSGKKKAQFAKNKNAELFQLIAGDYIRMAFPRKSSLITKGTDDFDWFVFFYQLATDNSKKRLMLVNNQRISLQSTAFPAKASYKLFAFIQRAQNDSVIKEIPIDGQAITVSDCLFPDSLFQWTLKIGYNNEEGRFTYTAVTENSITTQLVTREKLDSMAAFFFASWNQYYQDRQTAENEFRKWLQTGFGAFVPGPVEAAITKYLR